MISTPKDMKATHKEQWDALSEQAGDLLIRCSLTDTQVERIRRAVPGMTVHVAVPGRTDDEDAIRMLRSSQVAFGQIPPGWLDRAESLRWIQLDSVGFDPYLKPDGRRFPHEIEITNLRDLFATPVTETVIAGLLAIYRGINRLQACRSEARWAKNEIRPGLRCLRGSRVLLVGYGSIGNALHRVLSGFGCEMTAFARTNPEAQLHTIEALDEALSCADVVCLSLPQTPQTVGLFDRQRLARLRASAVLVNVGRAGVVDEAALVEALDQGRLAGAVLDVTESEPLPAGHPLWSTPNTILTQHTGGGTATEQDDKVSMFLENLRRYLAGQTLHNRIDLGRGY